MKPRPSSPPTFLLVLASRIFVYNKEVIHNKDFLQHRKIVKFKLINRSLDIDLRPEDLSIYRAKS
jgi:hypothetical protein